MRIRNRQSAIRNSPGAFTLLEVMIAGALFFMAVFAILGLVATTLRNARALQQTEPREISAICIRATGGPQTFTWPRSHRRMVCSKPISPSPAK
jgi:hypothetical protein